MELHPLKKVVRATCRALVVPAHIEGDDEATALVARVKRNLASLVEYFRNHNEESMAGKLAATVPDRDFVSYASECFSVEKKGMQ